MPEPMKNRVIRCDDPTWEAAQARAAECGDSISAVVRRLLKEYSMTTDALPERWPEEWNQDGAKLPEGWQELWDKEHSGPEWVRVPIPNGGPFTDCYFVRRREGERQ